MGPKVIQGNKRPGHTRNKYTQKLPMMFTLIPDGTKLVLAKQYNKKHVQVHSRPDVEFTWNQFCHKSKPEDNNNTLDRMCSWVQK